MSSILILRTQVRAFSSLLLERAGLLEMGETIDAIKEPRQEKKDAESAEESAEERREKEITQRYAKTDEKILDMNVILMYKKLVEGLVYSPPDCDKYLGLDAQPL